MVLLLPLTTDTPPPLMLPATEGALTVVAVDEVAVAAIQPFELV